MFRIKLIAFAVTALSVAGCASLSHQQANAPFTRPPVYGVTSEAEVRIGREFQEQGRYDEAIAAYTQALARNPTPAEALNGLGVIYAGQGRLDEAIEKFRAAIANAPDAAHLRNNLGYALLLRGDDGAAAALEEALRLEPGNEKAQQNLKQARRLAEAAVPPSAPQPHPAPLAPPDDAPNSGVVAANATLALRQARWLAEAAVPPSASQPRPAPVAPASEAPTPSVITANAMLHAIAAGGHEPQSMESAEARKSAPPRAQAAASAPRPYKLELSNGNGVAGMARRVADYLARHSIATSLLTNGPTFREATSIIEYRTGYRAEALALAEALPRPVPAIESNTLRRDIQIRVVFGQDMISGVALFDLPRPQQVTDASVVDRAQ